MTISRRGNRETRVPVSKPRHLLRLMGAILALSGAGLTVGIGTASASTTNFGTGTWVVNSQIAPGTYRTAGGSKCYWARLRNFN